MRIFQTDDSQWVHCNGVEVVATSPLPDEAYDKTEVGPMFYATLANGTTVEAFEDEIVESDG